MDVPSHPSPDSMREQEDQQPSPSRRSSTSTIAPGMESIEEHYGTSATRCQSRLSRLSTRRLSRAESTRDGGLRRLTTEQSDRAIRHSFSPFIYTEADVEATLSDHTEADEKLKDPSLVTFDGPDDPENPMNWPTWKKWSITMTASFMAVVVSFGSAVFSAAVGPTAKEFHVSTVVTTFGVAAYILGFSAGPLVWGPASEAFGRKTPVIISFIIFTIFQIPVAVAQNLETIMVCRFFSGAFGVGIIAIAPGMFVDFWDPTRRGISLVIYMTGVVCAPCLGPCLGAFTVINHNLGWRWTAWFTMIVAAPCILIALIPNFWNESLAAIILQRKAARLRLETRDWALHSKLDEHPVQLKDVMQKNLIKPFKMLVQEPILIAMTAFMSLVYAYLYMTFSAVPFAFENVRHWSAGVGSLPFLSVLVGSLLASVGLILESELRYKKLVKRFNGSVPAEQRLPLMIVGSITLSISLFWFSWTAFPTISPWPQIISLAFFGAGVVWVFVPGMMYIADVYLFNANSALAANTCVRSAFAAGCAMFADPMFRSLRVHWASSLLAFLCLALVPFPIIFWFYGARIRALSKFTPQ